MRPQRWRLALIVMLVLWWVVGCQPEESPAEVAAIPAEGSSVEESPAEAATVAHTEAPRATPTEEPAPEEDPAVAVVQEHIARVNAGDYAGAVELLAEDMMAYFIGMPPVGMEIYWGREQYQTFLEECCTDQHFAMEVVPTGVEDGMVFAETQTWMDFTRDLGVAPNRFYEIYRVEDGLITLYVSAMMEEALAKFRPALGEVMPEAFALLEPPDVTGVEPASEITVTIENGTCSYDAPPALRAGELIVHATVVDDQFDKYGVSFFTLDEGKDMLDLMASTYLSGPPDWVGLVLFEELYTGNSWTYDDYQIAEGLLYLVCWAEPQGMPIGNGGPFVVVP